MSNDKENYIEEMYDYWAGCYDNEFKHNGWCGPERLAMGISKSFNIAANDLRILDIGIGTGMLSAQFKAQNPSCYITGMDISAGMLEECRKKQVADELIEINFEKKRFPFNEGAFDLVVSSGVFELLDEPDKVIKEMGRVLAPSGAFAFTVYANTNGYYSCNRHPDELIEGALTDAGLTIAQKDHFHAFNHYGNDIYYHLYTGTSAAAAAPRVTGPEL